MPKHFKARALALYAASRCRPLGLVGVLLLLPMVLAAPAAGEHPCSTTLRVLDPRDHPVPGAHLSASTGSFAGKTDSSGRACLASLGRGRHRLLVSADGYLIDEALVEVDPTTDRTFEVRLRPAFGEELVVTATRTEHRLADTPVHVQVLDRKLVEATASRTLADSVEWVSGLRVESNCQNCNFSQVRLLGLEGPYTQILVDGQPTVSALAMVYGMEQIPARLIEAIEVVKGGGSAIYGAGAVGGVINLIPHQPSHTSAALATRGSRMGGETGHSLSMLADWTAPSATRSLTAYGQLDEVAPVDVDADGFTEVSRRRLEAFGLRLDQYALSDRGRFAFELNHTYEDRRGGDRLDLPPHEAEIAEEILSRRRGATASWLHTVDPRWDYRLSLSFSDTSRDSYYGVGRDPNAYGATENPLWIADAQFNAYRKEHTLTWGLQASRDEIRDEQLGYGRSIEATHEARGVYLQDDRPIGRRTTLLYGLRVDGHSELSDPIVSPRVSLLLAPQPELSLRASVATGFRPPVVFDEDLHITLVGGGETEVVRNAPDLAEETSLGMMLGLEWRPTFRRQGAAAYEVNLFRTEIEDLFYRELTDDPTTPVIERTRVNLGGAVVEGVEVNAALRWGPVLAAEVGFTRQTARHDHPETEYGSRDFYRTPESYGLATITWTPPGRFELFAGALYTGSMLAPHYAGFIEMDRLERTPSFLTFDVNISYRFSLGSGDRRGLTLTAGVKNVSNAFQEDLDRGPDRDASYVYGPRFPRSVLLGVKVAV